MKGALSTGSQGVAGRGQAGAYDKLRRGNIGSLPFY